jgi:hypothetical protein
MMYFRKAVFGLICVFIPFCLSVAGQTPTTSGSAEISGQLKIGEKGAPGVSVAVTPANPRAPGGLTPARTVTDDEGRYKIAHLAPGSYRIEALAPGFVISSTNAVVQLSERQSLTGVDFALTKGGVITGQVTINGGRPIIGETVNLLSVDENGQPSQLQRGFAANFKTDDRGVYRIYGAATGKYVVSVGRNNGSGRGPGGGGFNSGANAPRAWQLTYAPDALEIAQASIIDVEAGKEIEGVDIRVASRETYAAAGRVIDAETGKPIGGILIGHGRTSSRGGQGNRGNRSNAGDGGRSILTGGVTDGSSGPEGDFRIEGLTPGTYAVYLAQDPAGGQIDYYADPIPFEIASGDIEGLEIKLQQGVSVSGLVILDGQGAPNPSVGLSNLIISAQSRGQSSGGVNGGSGVMMRTAVSAQLETSGGFRLSGLAPGSVSLNVRDMNSPGNNSGLTVLRVEREGADVQAGLRAEAGEQLAGVRVVVAYGRSVIRGTVRINGGASPAGVRFLVTARRTGADRTLGNSAQQAQVDANGRFQIERLVAGAYEVSVRALGGGSGRGGSALATQTVTVSGAGVQEAILSIDFAAIQQGDQNRTGQPRRPRGDRR